jgi:large subunit ribosomal protein LP0
MPREDRVTWKSNYFLKIIQLLDDYPKCFIVGADAADPLVPGRLWC